MNVSVLGEPQYLCNTVLAAMELPLSKCELKTPEEWLTWRKGMQSQWRARKLRAGGITTSQWMPQGSVCAKASRAGNAFWAGIGRSNKEASLVILVERRACAEDLVEKIMELVMSLRATSMQSSDELAPQEGAGLSEKLAEPTTGLRARGWRSRDGSDPFLWP